MNCALTELLWRSKWNMPIKTPSMTTDTPIGAKFLSYEIMKLFTHEITKFTTHCARCWRYKDKKDTCSVLCIAWYPIHICIRLSRSEPAVGRGRHITVIVIIIINKKSWCNVKRQVPLWDHRGRTFLGKLGKTHQRMVLMDEQTSSSAEEKGAGGWKKAEETECVKAPREERGWGVWGNRTVAGKVACKGLSKSFQMLGFNFTPVHPRL